MFYPNFGMYVCMYVYIYIDKFTRRGSIKTHRPEIYNVWSKYMVPLVLKIQEN
jgi:hypothetical protein